ncbi:hypothetical protein GA-1p48 [Bacillus phage GA1]|uniref:Uncharacterized protein n=1 Tax=Bacillus phage GA-1 TaxID=2679898 RepID=Q9FZV0_BPGA1|nr:hypothetical protein GA-1p48 [Bacillus phage GA1]CAC21546.1 hypothetical protein [Bacillus phage GA1]
MITMTDFISLVEENMIYALFELSQPSEGIEQVIVHYKDYEIPNSHYYKIQAQDIYGELLVTLEIFSDYIDRPIETVMTSSLEETFNIMKEHDDKAWFDKKW